MTQKPVARGHGIEVADNWWLLAAVGFPLTAVTFMCWAISQRMFLVDTLQELRTRIDKAPNGTGIEGEKQEIGL